METSICWSKWNHGILRPWQEVVLLQVRWACGSSDHASKYTALALGTESARPKPIKTRWCLCQGYGLDDNWDSSCRSWHEDALVWWFQSWTCIIRSGQNCFENWTHTVFFLFVQHISTSVYPSSSHDCIKVWLSTWVWCIWAAAKFPCQVWSWRKLTHCMTASTPINSSWAHVTVPLCHGHKTVRNWGTSWYIQWHSMIPVKKSLNF